MQYILTQDEFDSLKKEQAQSLKLSKEKLQQLCTKIADTMPVEWVGWGKSEPTPWGCIHTNNDWECDNCPVIEICPSTKRWSK